MSGLYNCDFFVQKLVCLRCNEEDCRIFNEEIRLKNKLNSSDQTDIYGKCKESLWMELELKDVICYFGVV